MTAEVANPNEPPLSPDNPAYPAWEEIEPEEVRFIGRVIWLGRRV